MTVEIHVANLKVPTHQIRLALQVIHLDSPPWVIKTEDGKQIFKLDSIYFFLNNIAKRAQIIFGAVYKRDSVTYPLKCVEKSKQTNFTNFTKVIFGNY